MAAGAPQVIGTESQRLRWAQWSTAEEICRSVPGSDLSGHIQSHTTIAMPIQRTTCCFLPTV